MSLFKIVLPLTFSLLCCPLTLTAQNSLADEVTGTYLGILGKNGDKVEDYKIEITKMDDQTVQISPASGTASSTFEANVSENMLGNIRTISFSANADVMLQNANLVPATGRFVYAIINMSGGSREVEVFNGNKEDF